MNEGGINGGARPYGWVVSPAYPEPGELVHVMPRHGPAHHPVGGCWCEPLRDGDLIIHREVH